MPSGAPSHGAALIIPPPSWKPRHNTEYTDILSETRIISNPIMQSVEEIDEERGLYTYTTIPWAHTGAGKKWLKKHQGAVQSKKEDGKKITEITLTVSEYIELIEGQKTIKTDDEFWEAIRGGQLNAIYGTDVPNSLMDSEAGSWNLDMFCETTLLHEVKDTMNVPGIRNSYLYFGSPLSTFAWHTENIDLFSANYLHHGMDKIWYVIPAASAKKFESLIEEDARKLYPTCSTPFRHHPFIIDPSILSKKYGIKITRVEQIKGSFVITFPYAYHSGYNTGFNIAEAANFATNYWMPFGITAERCDCINDVAFPIGKFIQLEKGEDFYRKWLSNTLTHEESLVKVPEVGNWVVSGQTDIDWTIHDAEMVITRKDRLQQLNREKYIELLRAERKKERLHRKMIRKQKIYNGIQSSDIAIAAGVSEVDTDDLMCDSHRIPHRKQRKHMQLKCKRAMKKKEAEAVRSKPDTIELSLEQSSQAMHEPQAANQ